MHQTEQNRWITPTAFREALADADSRLVLIRERYPSLGAYVVLARGGLQIEPGADLPKLAKDLPELFADCPAKFAILQLLKGKGKISKAGELNSQEIQDQKAQIAKLSTLLRIDGSFLIELRFRNLDYKAIWKLKMDALVDQDLTPPSKASIRIVLMSIRCLQGTDV